ncbi:MAG: sodium:proline symporter [Micavibrio sp.]|nr:sodium:proline symporter [Micavibrio sp.]
MNLILISFFAFLSFFLFTGLLSVRKRQKSAEDYLLASRKVSPSFVGLSGAASTASGFGFTGIIAFGYAMGLSGAWFIFGVIFGSFIAFSLTSRRFRVFSQREGAASFAEFLTSGMGEKGGGARKLQVAIGLVSIFAVLLYATAQLTAGSKALHVLFGWDYGVGAMMGAVIVVMYCFAGGIRASIWTDVAQIIVMYGAMTLLAIVSLNAIGGFGALYSGLEAIDPKLVHILPQDNPFGPVLFILGWMSVGLSFIGFPHVMVRFMTLEKSKDTKKALAWYQGYYGAFYITAYIVALCTRILIPDSAEFDKELALPELAQQMLPEVLVGVILAGIFAGTISTADSLVLSCTASISRDLAPKYKESYLFLKISTIGVTAAALALALFGSKSVFDLVLFAITIMGAGFAPIMLVRVMKWRLTPLLAFMMMVAGIAVGIAWRIEGYHVYVYDALPGIVMAFLVYGAGRVMFRMKK